jgi:hypothetical protein
MTHDADAGVREQVSCSASCSRCEYNCLGSARKGLQTCVGRTLAEVKLLVRKWRGVLLCPWPARARSGDESAVAARMGIPQAYK